MRQDFPLRSADGTDLQARFTAGIEPRGTLVISHGLGEHSLCYDALVGTIASRPGLANVLAFDYRGHGASPGRRGYVRTYENFLDDLHAALSWCKSRNPGLPIHVLGHSNGGQVALHMAGRPENLMDGLILSNPSLRVLAPVPLHKLLAGKVLRRLAPTVTLASTVLDEELSRDPAYLASRKVDPLRHGRIGAPLYFGMVEGGARILRSAETIRLPLLLLLGEADPVVDAAATKAFFYRVASPDKTLRLYPEMYHEPLNDIGRERVVVDLIDWLSQHLPSPDVSR